MFDIGWAEMMFVVIIAVLVIGPKDLPGAIATIGKYVRKARSMARDFQSGIDDLAKETEIADIKKDLMATTDFNIKKQIEDAVDPTGRAENMFEDMKPEIRDPRLPENNYSKADENKGEGEGIQTAAVEKTEASEPELVENNIAGAVDVPTDTKPETKSS